MCGIGGLLDLSGQGRIPDIALLENMANAMFHRGPDEDGFYIDKGIALISRRLNIMDPQNGKQPVVSNDKNIYAVYNGEIFNYQNIRNSLKSKGVKFFSECDSELIPHLWLEFKTKMWEQINGQFATAVWDSRLNVLSLARDQFGIAPLFYGIIDKWLVFGSEIRVLLATGLFPIQQDPKAISQYTTFFCLPNSRTMFQGIKSLSPGSYLLIKQTSSAFFEFNEVRFINNKAYPENRFTKNIESKLVEELNTILLESVRKRLMGDCDVGAFLSGGVDSSILAAMANMYMDKPLQTYTISINHGGLNEAGLAAETSKTLGLNGSILNLSQSEVMDAYPDLIRVAEAPVFDLSCAAVMLQARRVSDDGIRVMLAGEGADELFGGYPWHKISKFSSFLNQPNFDIEQGIVYRMLIETGLKACGLGKPDYHRFQRMVDLSGGLTGWNQVHGFIILCMQQFMCADFLSTISDYEPYEDIGLNSSWLKGLTRFNRELEISQHVQLPGLLLSSKGDRVNMNSSVEARYPFLDSNLVDFASKLHEDYKLNGYVGKYLLRKVAEKWLPKATAWRRKAMFRAPFESFSFSKPSGYVEFLLSKECIDKTMIFDYSKISKALQDLRTLDSIKMQRVLPRKRCIEIGLASVLSIQCWHYTFILKSAFSAIP